MSIAWHLSNCSISNFNSIVYTLIIH
jgi:hypothetical protein